MRAFLALVVVVLSFTEVVSQSFYAIRRERSLILVGGTGTSTYFGELSNDGDYIDAKPNINVGLQYFVTKRVSARAEITWFTLAGTDEKADEGSGRRERNLSFKSSNYEVNLSGAINLFSNTDRYYRRPNFNAYLFTGVGFMYSNPKTEYNGEKIALRPLKTEGVSYGAFGIVIPYGFGLRWKLNPMFNVVVEGGWRKIFTDYLDDVSTVHQNPSSFTDPIAAALSDRRPEIGLPKALPGSIRGNPKKDDAYMLFNAKIEYYLPWSFNQNKGTYSKKRKALNRRSKVRK